ncbi:Crp/Fnr family transcriptional regulator (plasmid) [Methylobacterium sp. NMS14P]|nr:Crp/Fnr family transcriptional regulator [Methylobacterium sp. NMS14P]WCS28584.1 Crp/Fnr family transcriptional regulator [Methylobacterium sp. NMS14P]
MPPSSDQHSMAMLLRKLESIGTLSDVERQAIQGLPVRTQTLNARQDIVRDGDRPSHCCLILDGWACRYKLLHEGRRQILSFHIAGDVPDLQTLHLPTMDHSLATVTKATVAFIPHESLRELTVNFPSIGALLWRDTLVDAGIFREWITGLGRRSAFERIAHLFCEMYLKLQAVGLAGDFRCRMPTTQNDLADALGLTPVHVNRVLRDMRGLALITLRSSTLVIEAWDELLRVAEFDPTYLHLEKPVAA